jgi:DNA processing protein|tara:strand:- start:3410 stop:3649 length:240 start_codon:yes stop_codon:yes gene_type:complete
LNPLASLHSTCVTPTTQDNSLKLSRRNRVISGLRHGVLVAEAAFNSGAMLTINWALEQDRDVIAVPGSSLNEKSKALTG